MKFHYLFGVSIVVGAACSTAGAACPSDEQARAVADAYIAGRQMPAPQLGLTVEDAACGRDKVVRMIETRFGKVIGYKAGLTNPAVQKVFDYFSPVRGALLEKMLRREGEDVSVGAGGPVFEADLVMEVKDSSINDAKTALEALRGIKAVYPFIEVPYAVFNAPSPAALGGPNLIFSNVAAFSGVLGKPVVLEPTQGNVDALANMTVTLMDATGKQLDSAKGGAIMGNPLNAVLWIAEDVKKSGGRLKPGDLLSLGSFSRLHPAKPGEGARVRYEGLPGNPEVTARFVQ